MGSTTITITRSGNVASSNWCRIYQAVDVSQAQIRILCVDDHPLLRAGIAGLIADEPDMVLVAEAENGRDAIEQFSRHRPDVTLMDLQMPEMDGLDASRRICAQWGPGERPRIVAMTANAMQGDRDMCLAAGMDDYVTKPIRVEQLVEALNHARARQDR
jgi:CheY-like chemotaxis protein